MITPTLRTDAAPPERNAQGLIFLAGAIKWWWLSTCMACHWQGELEEGGNCPDCGYASQIHVHWDSPEHKNYVRYRNDVRAHLIDQGFLTYAPHEAFKGIWVPKAQSVNDMAIAESDVMLVLSPSGIITDGTDDEVAYAERVNTPVYYAPPGHELRHTVFAILTIMDTRRRERRS